MKYLVISDIHLGHRQTPTEHVIRNLYKYVLTEENKDIDVFIIAGDLYDRALEVRSRENIEIIKFLSTLLSYCHTNNIKLRALKGTPGHEWDQLLVLGALNSKRDEPVDYKYFPALEIEYMPDYDKYVLYIPDEWSNDHALIESQIEEECRSLGIDKVDIAILHSLFNYQMAGIPYTGFRYDEGYFLNKVKEYIVIGHIHTHSNYDRIIAGGGFDRYSHGEQGDKGYIIIDHDNTWCFAKNGNPYVYKTIKVTKNDNLTTLGNKILKYPERSHIRLNMPKDHELNLIFKQVQLAYRQYNLTRKVDDTQDSKSITSVLNESDFKLTEFNAINVNLKEELKEIVLSKNSFNESQLGILEEYLVMFDNTSHMENE